mmetsp:Transcript_100149/g.161454  ORF Transcript_100149/g.161454 Transcript_100149/m.161454 type:complete len:227 (-) Transcript_100149:1039-1719(-)
MPCVFLSRPSSVLPCSSRHAYPAQAFPANESAAPDRAFGPLRHTPLDPASKDAALLREHRGDLGIRGHKGHVAIGCDRHGGGEHLARKRRELVHGYGVDLLGDGGAALALAVVHGLSPKILGHDAHSLEVEEERRGRHVLSALELLGSHTTPQTFQLPRQQRHSLGRILSARGGLDTEEARVLVRHVEGRRGQHLGVGEDVAENARREPLAGPARRKLVTTTQQRL